MPSREPKGSFFDPEYRRERAREAARESHRSGAVTRLIHALPHLTDEQIQRIRDALPPVDDSHGDAA